MQHLIQNYQLVNYFKFRAFCHIKKSFNCSQPENDERLDAQRLFHGKFIDWYKEESLKWEQS